MGKRKKRRKAKAKRRNTPVEIIEYAVYARVHEAETHRNFTVQCDVNATSPDEARCKALTLVHEAWQTEGRGKVGCSISDVYRVSKDYELLDPESGKPVDYRDFDIWVTNEDFIEVNVGNSKPTPDADTDTVSKEETKALPPPAKPSTAGASSSTTTSYQLLDSPVEELFDTLGLMVVEYDTANNRKPKQATKGGDT